MVSGVAIVAHEPKADWYVWVDGKPGTPPNNWLSIFGHSAWQWDATRQQYYYHAFYKQQPDLNWRNRQVRDAMYEMIRGWMQRGVAGFRLDAVPQLFEDPQGQDEKYLPGLTAYGDRQLRGFTPTTFPRCMKFTASYARWWTPCRARC